MAIDDPDHEVPPAGPGRKRVRTAIGCIFIIGILIFLVWFSASNTEQQDGGSLFGMVADQAIDLPG